MIYFIIPPTFNNYNISRRSNCVVKAKGDYIYPPIEMATLAAYIRKSNFEVSLIDGNISNVKDVLNKINNPDYFVVNAGIFSFENDTKFLKILRNNFKAKIIVYGQAANALPLEALKFSDYVIIGEPEKTLLEILENKALKGVCFRKDNEIYINMEPNFIKNLDDLPLPARDLLDNKRYKHAFLSPFTEIFTSRGCPFNCIFCTSINYFARYRSRSAKSVIEELKDILSYGIKNFAFADDTFTINKKKVVEISNWIIKNKIKFNWLALSRVDTVTFDLLKIMKRAGCNVMLYGIESGSQEVLDRLKKDITLEQIKETIKWTKEAGIETHGYFIMGSPFETKEDAEKTIKFAKTLKLDYASFNVFIPYPGTDAYSYLSKENKIISNNWLDYDQTTGKLVYKHDSLTNEEIKELIKMAYKNFYLSPIFIFYKIKNHLLCPKKLIRDFANFKKLNVILK